jgi:hypothetical protein
MFERLKEKYATHLLEKIVAYSCLDGSLCKLAKEHIKASLDQMNWREFIEDIRCNNMLQILSAEDIIKLYLNHYNSDCSIGYSDIWKSTGLPFQRVDYPHHTIFEVAGKFFKVYLTDIVEVKLVTKTITTWEKV